MLVPHHALAAAVAGVALSRRRWDRAAYVAFVAAAVLIDVDHYLAYVWKTGDWSPGRAIAYHRSRYVPFQWRLRPRWPRLGFEEDRLFHAAPVLLALFALGRRWPALSPVACGVLFHRVQDELWGWVTRP